MVVCTAFYLTDHNVVKPELLMLITQNPLKCYGQVIKRFYIQDYPQRMIL